MPGRFFDIFAVINASMALLAAGICLMAWLRFKDPGRWVFILAGFVQTYTFLVYMLRLLGVLADRDLPFYLRNTHALGSLVVMALAVLLLNAGAQLQETLRRLRPHDR